MCVVEQTVPGRKNLTIWGRYRPWQNKKRQAALCSNCGGKQDRVGQRGYCRSCHNAYHRLHRLKHGELSALARQKAIARSYAKVYLKRGKLKPKPCERCGLKKVQMHHDDYSKPLQVRWLCRRCHLALHREYEAANDPATLKKVA